MATMRVRVPGRADRFLKKTAWLTLRTISGAVDLAILAVFLLLFAFGCYALWDSSQVYQSADPAKYEAYKPAEEGSLSFEELQGINSEVVGWLTVYGTGIDYPLVKAKDNDKYLDTDATGEHSTSGSLFLDYRNTPDFSDYNTIIYGHHMSGGAMFGDIGEFADPDYFNEHRYGSLYCGEKEYGLEFLFLMATEANSEVYSPAVKGAEAQSRYRDALRADAVCVRDAEIAVTDRLLLLSTCTTDITNGRYILAGRILPEAVDDPFAADEGGQEKRKKTIDRSPARNGTVWSSIRQWPFFVWPLLMLITLVIVLVIYNAIRRKYGANKGKARRK